MDRKSKAIHPDKCSACLLPLPGGDLAQSIREQRQSLGHRRSTSGLGNLSSFETHQWGEGGMAWASNGSCLEDSEGSWVCWRSASRHVLEGQRGPSFSFMGGYSPVKWDVEECNNTRIFQAYYFLSRVKNKHQPGARVCPALGSFFSQHE